MPRRMATTLRPFGYYVSGDYQFARRWFLGGRFDRSQRRAFVRPAIRPLHPRQTFSGWHSWGTLFQDSGGSLLLTYWPSEFSQIRGQLRRTDYGEGNNANEFLFQFIFSIGAHGAHPF